MKRPDVAEELIAILQVRQGGSGTAFGRAYPGEGQTSSSSWSSSVDQASFF